MINPEPGIFLCSDSDDIIMDKSAPPPYSLTAPAGSRPTPTSQYGLEAYRIHYATWVSGVTNQLSRERRNPQQVDLDVRIFGLLAFFVDEFIAELNKSDSTPPLATLALAPKIAVPNHAQLSGIDEMIARGEVGRVIRVEVQHNMKGEGSVMTTGATALSTKDKATNEDVLDFGRWDEGPSSPAACTPLLWWDDEERAKRLAAYLQPSAEYQARPRHRQKDKWINMKVNAERIAFRHQNDFGLWESISGWGIVVTLKILPRGR